MTQFIELRSQYGVLKFNALKFLACIVILNTPFIIIMVVWYIVSTPTAQWVKIDGVDEKHYICVSGGLVEGLTWVFFFILVGYAVSFESCSCNEILIFFQGIVLVLSAVFVFVTRSIKTKYNEAQTIALSVSRTSCDYLLLTKCTDL